MAIKCNVNITLLTPTSTRKSPNDLHGPAGNIAIYKHAINFGTEGNESNSLKMNIKYMSTKMNIWNPRLPCSCSLAIIF